MSDKKLKLLVDEELGAHMAALAHPTLYSCLGCFVMAVSLHMELTPIAGLVAVVTVVIGFIDFKSMRDALVIQEFARRNGLQLP